MNIIQYNVFPGKIHRDFQNSMNAYAAFQVLQVL